MGFHVRKASQSGSGAPTAVVPDYIGQVYTDTAGPTNYIAFGTSAGNWTDVEGGVGSSTNYPDPWEALAGDEVFSDDFETFSGWTTYNGFNTTTTPSIDTAASVFRAKGANPCVDSSLRTRGIVVMPENNTSTSISITKDVSGVLTASGNWLMMAKFFISHHRLIANNSVSAAIGFSLPASNSLRYNAVELFAMEQDASVSGIQCQRSDNNSIGNITEMNTAVTPAIPNGIWAFLYHQSGSSDVNAFFSIDGGRTLCELGIVTKNPSTFTTFYVHLAASKQMVTHQQIEVAYVRVYQSLKQR